MKFIENMNQKEYEQFVQKHPNKSHFMQSYIWGEVMREKNFNPHYVGIKENNKVIATALLLEKKLIGKYSYLYCPRGFILDYENDNLIKKMTSYLKKYAKKINSIFIKIDPDIKRHDLDINGNIINPDHNNYHLISLLESLEYKNKGFNKEFVNEQPRFTFRLNLNQDFKNIEKGMHPTTRKIYHKKNPLNLNIYIGNEEDIDLFYETMIQTAQRENIRCYPIQYYKKFYQVLNKKNMCDLYIVTVDLDILKKDYQNKIDKINNEIKDIDKSKYQNKQKLENKIKEYTNSLNKAKKELESIKKIKEKTLTLSSIMTVKYGDKVWTIHGGNHSLLRELNANYLLYFKIIEDAYNQGYKLIDFFGTSGDANPDKSSPTYGIHLFKKRLGGEYTEFIGEYDLIINRFLYNCYHKLIPLYRKIKKR